MTITIIVAVAMTIVAYLTGSANTSIIITRIMGSDIREHGSGNAGATNMLRTYGKRFGALTLVCDVLKGVLAVGLGWIAEQVLRVNGIGESIILVGIKYYAAAAVVLGHNYPLFFGFRGGKGIATSGAVIFMLDWRVGLILLTIALVIMAVTRYVSLGSIVAASAYPIFTAVFVFTPGLMPDMTVGWTAFITSLFVGPLAVYRHNQNIVRLFKGTESKLGKKKEQ